MGVYQLHTLFATFIYLPSHLARLVIVLSDTSPNRQSFYQTDIYISTTFIYLLSHLTSLVIVLSDTSPNWQSFIKLIYILPITILFLFSLFYESHFEICSIFAIEFLSSSNILHLSQMILPIALIIWSLYLS